MTDKTLSLLDLAQQREDKDKALRAVLLFFSEGGWNHKKQELWTKFTGTQECNAQNLCDMIRRVLSE